MADPRVTQDAVETLSQPVLPASRVSQSIIEILGASVAVPVPPRVTQAVIELLSQGLTTVPVPDLTGLTLAEATAALTTAGFTLGTVTGDPAGVVISQSPTAGTLVVAGTPVDVTLEVPPAEAARVTQALVELLSPVPPILGRVTQLAVDVFYPRTVAGRQTQAAVEVLVPILVTGRHTQSAVELFRSQPARTRATQLVVELFLTVPPCVLGAFPVDTVAAGGSCPVGVLP